MLKLGDGTAHGKFEQLSFARVYSWLLFSMVMCVYAACLLVGARLILVSETIEDVILNSVAAIFVLQLDEMIAKCILPSFANFSEILIDSQPPNMFDLVVSSLMYFQVIPCAMAVIMFFVPWWD